MVSGRKSKKAIIEDKFFDTVNFIILTIVLLLVLYPLYFIIIASISNPDGIYQGKIWLLPYKPNLEGYRAILAYDDLWMGYKNSIIYTVAGVAFNIFCTFTIAFPLSRKRLPGKGIITLIMVFTMYFGGGLIPSYLLIKNLGMLDTIWALILPGGVSVFNVVIVRTFFQSTIPEELYESAAMDGCSNTRFFLQILMPLSTAVIAVMVLFYGVGHWNAFFNAMIYLNSRSKYPLQLILREILVVVDNSQKAMTTSANQKDTIDSQQLTELIKYGIIIVSSLPVLILYPFLQKYFVKGVMIGSLKG